MPKKSATARSGAQRQRPRTQKSFELVRPTTTETEDTTTTADSILDEEQAGQSVATITATERTTNATPTTESEPEHDTLMEEETNKSMSEPVVVPSSRKTTAKSAPVTQPAQPVPAPANTKAGAAARFAARRQAQQKAQQKNVASLVTTEHFAYVRHDLIVIATLAVIMFAAIIILYFTIGR